VSLTLLEITVDKADFLDEFEQLPSSGVIREWLVPLAILNPQVIRVRIILEGPSGWPTHQIVR
jgi:hypothetical protein